MSKGAWANAISFLLLIPLVLALELGSGWLIAQTARKSQLQEITSFLQRDEDLIWTQKKAIKTRFFEAEVETDEYGWRNPRGSSSSSDSKDTILVLGASPSFGWGVESPATYSRFFESALSGRGGRAAKVVNASVVGYSSWQGLKLLKENAARIKPRHIIVSYGINDVSRDRFYYSGTFEDKDLNVRFAGLQNVLFDSSFVQLLARGLASFRSEDHVRRASPVRVSLDDYLKNHSEMIRIAKELSATISFLIIPVHFTAEQLPADQVPELRQTEARSLQYFQALRELSKKENVKVTDTSQALLDCYDDCFLTGRHDFIHPSARGHRIIGEALVAQLQPLFIKKVTMR